MKRRSTNPDENKKILLTVIAVLFCAFVVIMFKEYRDKKEFEEHTQQMNQQAQVELSSKEKKRKELEATSNFYQKLSEGFDVNILVVGDSIESGDGVTTRWRSLLKTYLEENYYVTVGVTNVSMEGNSSYAGYVRTMALDDGIDYDLAIICYGQYDDEEDFSLYYESIIRAIGNKYDNCCIVSILESSQMEYTNKMQIIQEIAAHYGIPVADTIAAFNSGEYGETGDFSELTDDRIHPNDLGNEVYFEVIRKAIEDNVTDDFKVANTEPINKEIQNFDTFRYISLEEFERVDDFSYEILTSAEGKYVGIDYYYLVGENLVEIYADGVLAVSVPVTHEDSFSQRRIAVIGNDFDAKSIIRVVFGTKEEAESFQGLIFNGFDEEII